MRASRSKKRTDEARSTQNRGGAGRARKAGGGTLERPAKRASKAPAKGGKPSRNPAPTKAAGAKSGAGASPRRKPAPTRPPAASERVEAERISGDQTTVRAGGPLAATI